MTYYRVKPKYDCTELWLDGKHHGTLIRNELYTERELAKKNILLCHGVTLEFFDKVEISSKRTYWFFGCRFEYHD